MARPTRSPPPPAPPSDEEQGHVLLGRIVRHGLGHSSRPPGPPPLVQRAYQPPAARSTRRFVPALFGGLAVAATVLIVAFSGTREGAGPALAYHFEAAGESGRARGGVAGDLPADLTGEGRLRFAEGSTLDLRGASQARLTSVSAHGARLRMLDGRVRAHIQSNRSNEWALEAGPYRVSPSDGSATSLDLNWLGRRELLLVSVRTGRASVQGASTGPRGVVLGPGETLLARASDGLARVGEGHLLLDSLSQDDAEPVTRALTALAEDAAADEKAADEKVAEAPGEEGRERARTAEGLLPVAEAGACRPHESSAVAEALPDPGPVSLLSCRHFDAGPTGKDLRARPASPLWVRPGANGCLKYTEDARGNRIPDFSHSGYGGGGVPLPRVAAAPGPAPLLPSGTGDDTAAIQGAIDAAAGLPPDAQGFRGAVELGPGVFTVGGVLRMPVGGVVLRGQGTEGSPATLLRAVGPPRTLVQMGPAARRRAAGKEAFPITDVYVPVGARTFTVERIGDLKVGDEIVVHRPKSQRWICAIGTDFLPVRRDGTAAPPWKARGGLTFERRITRVDGNRITVDVPMTNALEKEYTQAYVTRYDFLERVSELGIERLAARAEFTQPSACPSGKGEFVRVHAVSNAWIREVRVEGFGGEAVTLEPPSKWVTVEDVTYVGVNIEGERCSQFAFNLGGQQNLIHRSRSYGSNVTALITGGEVEGPNAVVDFLAVGRGVRVRVTSRWSTGILLDNVRVQDSTGQPSGDFDLARGRKTFGWSAVNSVIWNSEADVFSVDDPPTARNWVMGGAIGARSLMGTGTYSADRALIEPRSLYRAQLAERLNRPQLSQPPR
jgi:hypothetical protein